MSARRLFAGLAASAVTVATLGVLAPAHADPSFVPVAGDIVGGGSDTSMYAMTYLAEGNGGVAGYNTGKSSGRLVSFDAKIVDAAGTQTNSAEVTLRQGSDKVARPNGSGQGKALLHGAGNNPDVDYARSSSGLNDAEKSAGLQSFPFAKDTLGMAVATNSNAPETISEADLVKIYDGTVTNWSQIGGKSGVIVPLIPQSGSGTRSFFTGELKRINGGSDVALAATIKEVQEHDDSPIKDDPNAIAPFSAGRAQLEGTLRITDGFTAARALYNVVRQADVAKPAITSIFGAGGFICSPEAAALIADAGFEQLLAADEGGTCGVPTQSSPDLATAKVQTTTELSGTSAQPGNLALTAIVGGGGELKPQGMVTFTVDGVEAGTAIVTGGRATLSLTSQQAGDRKVIATFEPTEGSVFGGSTSTEATVTVKDSVVVTPPKPTQVTSTLRETFKAGVKKNKRAAGRVVITLSDGKKATTGRVVIKQGKKVVGNVKVKNGRAVFTKKNGLKKLGKKGQKRLVATYRSGRKNIKNSTLRFTIRQR